MHESGYRFSHLDLDRLESDTFVAEVDFHESLGSTSDRAVERCLMASLPSPLLILTNEQTAGRGRGANRWWASSGALTFSLLLDADQLGLSQAALPQLSLVTALALCEALAEHEPQAEFRLKWPNDVYALTSANQPRKLAGILLERPLGPVPRVVIGIGLNVNNSHATAPAEIRERATSLCDVSSNEHALCDVLIGILQQLAGLLPLLAAGELNLPALWQPHCLLRGRHVVANSGTRQVEGICYGIDEAGALLIHQADRMEQLFSATIERFD